jgi:head-tail adaptor
MAIKLNTNISIITTEPTKDAEGFVTHGDTILTTVRAYFEPKNSTEKWRGSSLFSEADAIFRFRVIPGLEVTPQMVIGSGAGRYEIVSTENVRQRGMYIEVIAKKTEGSANG